MTDSVLLKKLQMKPGLRALFLNAPQGYVESLSPLPDGVALVDGPPNTLDLVQLFVRDRAELAIFAPVALAAIKRDGVFWISYPKKSSGVVSDLTRDAGWAPITAASLRPVTQIAVDETWSALRWRPIELVKPRASEGGKP